MKSLTRSFLFLTALLIISCTTNQQTNNASAPGPSTGVGQTGASNGQPQNRPIAAATTTPAAEAEEKGLSASFQGTAGITEKKSEAGSAALLTAVRTGQQENFDRIVFEFAGAELPGYHIEYVDQPVRSCGSGDVVPLKGDGWLEIRFYPANAHTEQGEPTVKSRELAPNHKIVKELKSTCDFEAEVEWVAGVASPNHYRVLELKNPVRLAVDIKH